LSKRNGKADDARGPLPLGQQSTPEDAQGVEKHPFLTDLLFPRFKDGKCVRQAGRLTLKIVGGYYVVTVACPTESVQTTLVFRTLEALLDQVEQSVQLSTIVWLPDFEKQKKDRQQAKL
jgi:hypothetical protein